MVNGISSWMTRVLPIVQIIVCLGASIVYLLARDWRHAAYWFFAGCLTATVTTF